MRSSGAPTGFGHRKGNMNAIEQTVGLLPAMDAATDAEERRKGIGGSDVAVILGLHPYKTALDLWMQKRGLWEDQDESEAAAWGRIMEPVLAREYARRYEAPVLRLDEHGEEVVVGMEHLRMPFSVAPEASRLLGTLSHPKHAWARGHVDGIGLSPLAAARQVVEFKTASEYLKGEWGEENTDHVPEHYLVQVQWYLMLTGLEVAHVGALIGGNRFRRYVITRDGGLIELLLERAAAFWDLVVSGDAPPPEPGERGKQSLSRLYPRGEPVKEILADATFVALARALHAVRRQAKEIEEQKVTAENQVKLLMADAGRLTLGPKSYISWTNNRDSRKTDWEAAFHALADAMQRLEIVEGEAAELQRGVLETFTTTKPGARVFRVQGLDTLFGEEA